MDNKHLIKGLELNKISKELIDKTVQIKAAVEALGWKFYSYDAIDGKFYVTLEIDKEDEGPEYDSAGFTEADRIVDGSYRVKSNITLDDLPTHHCDDPNCNCSMW